MKALVLLADGVEETEAVASVDVLRRAGVEVTLAAVQEDLTVRTAHGILLRADVLLQDLVQGADEALSEFGAVVLPGGMGQAKTLAASAAAGTLLVTRAKAGLLIAAICASPAVVLAPLGILAGKRATCYPGLEKALPVYVEEAVVTDLPFITSRGPGTTIPFALAVAEALAGSAVAARVAQDILYK